MFILLGLFFLPLYILCFSQEEVILLLFFLSLKVNCCHLPCPSLCFPLLVQDLEDACLLLCSCVPHCMVMCLVCPSSSFREKVWECLNPVENQRVLMCFWNYCPSGCFWSSREVSGLTAEKGKITLCLEMMVAQGCVGLDPREGLHWLSSVNIQMHRTALGRWEHHLYKQGWLCHPLLLTACWRANLFFQTGRSWAWIWPLLIQEEQLSPLCISWWVWREWCWPPVAAALF